MPDFGLVICTCKFDFFLAKSCVASARYSLGDVPVTLFIDDDLDARDFAKYYGIQLMYRRDVRDPWLRATNTGWGLPKMTLFWESPYENFLYLDCDTIVWGDVIKAYLQPFDADLIIDPGDVVSRPAMPGVGTDEQLAREYLNPDLFDKVFPEFPWRKYRNKYFCTGVYAARRNCLPLSSYQRIFESRRTQPGLFGLFPYGEMPILNFMIFDAEERGEIKVRRAPIQTVCAWENQDYLKSHFLVGASGPDMSRPAPTVLHFTDPKPIAASSGYNKPVQYFREKCAREFLGISSILAFLHTWCEELDWRLRIYYRRNFGGVHSRIRGQIRRLVSGASR